MKRNHRSHLSRHMSTKKTALAMAISQALVFSVQAATITVATTLDVTIQGPCI